MSRITRWAWACFMLLLAGCSSLPDALVVDDSVELNGYQRLATEQALQGEWYRIAGVIATVDNFDNRTRIEMANLPMKGEAKPNLNAEPEGRLVVYIDGFLDPVKFAPGRLLTINAIYSGVEQTQVGEHQLQLPVLQAQNYYLWTITERVVLNDPPGMFHCGYRYCRTYYPNTRHGRLIQDVK